MPTISIAMTPLRFHHGIECLLSAIMPCKAETLPRADADVVFVASLPQFVQIAVPQLDAAQQAFFIADYNGVSRQLERDLAGIASANVEPVIIEKTVQLLNGLANMLVPLLTAILV